MDPYKHCTIGDRVTIYPPCNIYGDSVIGDHCKIGANTEISGAWIGNNVTIGAMCFIPKYIVIEDGAWIGPRVTFCNDRYPPHGVWDVTTIARGAVIGAAVTLLTGVTIGCNALIGAGSVVTCDVPADEVWAGNPARKIKDKR
jgi:UDP-2-acetamido-3-amino-2,3-dideoxy-glucuronate N-acetyltransferase